MNHVIIGLGGTGGKIIRALRKLIYQEFRQEKPDGVELGYLYVDSSSEMMALNDSSWKTLGVSVQLPKASQLLITDANLVARLDNIDNYPGIKPWIGDREQWRDLLNSIVGVTLGGQKRRLGRFLFACKADRYREQVQTQVKRVQASGATEVTFHVLCGLAGGTGSGCVIDAIAQLRDLYPAPERYRILVYALLPDPYPPPNWDTGNYHANGYAALLELNALSTGIYQPYDVLSAKGRLQLSDPFNGCYVFSNENENGLTVDVDKDLPSIVADFLYQKITGARQVGWPTLARMENAENGDGSPETAPHSKRGERSKRFLAFGIKRVAIPEEEIREYLSYNFARQALLQLAFNHWQEALGFAEEVRNQDFNELVRQKDNQLRWLLSDDHLMLSLPILPGDGNAPKWQSITTEWETVIPHFKSLVRELDRATWLDELTKLCQKRFDEDYRNLGVVNFYRTKLKAKKDMAREIRLGLERELCNDWKIGARSLHDCSRLLAALLKSLDERLAGIDDKVIKTKAAEAEAQIRLQENTRKWAGMGIFSKMVGIPTSLLDSHAVYLQELYVNRTRIEALTFAKALLQEVIADLAELKGEVDKTAGTLQDALKRFAIRIQERCGDESAADLRRHLIRFYDPELVRQVNRALILDAETQRTQTSRARAALFEKLGESALFSTFNQRVPLSTLLDTLETICEDSARLAHATLIRDTKARVLGVSIIEKLEERFGADPQALRAYVTELVNHAGTYMSFEPMEIHKVAPGIAAGTPTCLSKFTVILPKAPEHADFTAALKESFRAAKSGDMEILDSDSRFNEITLISITNLFPLRYLKPLAFLRQRYERRISGADARRARLELHTEGDGSAFPSLYVATLEEIKRDGLPYVLLAKALGFIQEGRNPETGASEILLLSKDADGFDNPPLWLGKTFMESWQGLDLAKLDAIRSTVIQALASRDYTHQDRRLSLQQAVLASVEAIKAERGGNLRDEVYQRFLEAGKQGARILKREAT